MQQIRFIHSGRENDLNGLHKRNGSHWHYKPIGYSEHYEPFDPFNPIPIGSFNQIQKLQKIQKNLITENLDPIIVNKRDHMIKIRHAIRNSITNVSSNIKKDDEEFFIGLIHTYPAWKSFFNPLNWRNFASHSAHNPYGHTLAEFFKFEGGTLMNDTVMNIGTRFDEDGTHHKTDIVHFFDGDQYYFNSKKENESQKIQGNHQNGMFERSFISVNFRVNKKEWEEMQQYYYDLKRNKNVQFNIGPYMLTNKFRSSEGVKQGNCCYWTTKAFEAQKMLLTHSNFPLVAFYKLIINLMLNKGDYFQNNKNKDFSVTLYKGKYHEEQPQGSFLYPFYWLRHEYDKIWRTEDIANIVVSLQKNDQNKNQNQNIYDEVIIEGKNKNDTRKYTKKIVKYLNNILYPRS
ncbi:MAG: hypothetical protein Terrestrivirus3_140 [Terrestrivirus sp.]|uniref:Uncharacterized protein n=1 Tax=Terrestrivirus sp. TaxID=2487775 RepID=A0A3G4ZPI4_9VIRU|nr:MAG: hypothetical protein Terrestrivirus3_140 [Terrestrivirus sp.]